MVSLRFWTLTLAVGGLAAGLAWWSPPPAGAAGSGEEILKANTCNVCHSVSAAGIESKMKTGKMKGADLTLALQERDDAWIRAFVVQASKLDGRPHPKKFTGSDEELATLLGWLRSLPADGS